MEQELFSADGLVKSGRYAEVMNETVLPYLEAREEKRYLDGVGGLPLYTCRFRAENARGTVLIVHGFTENAFKFSELIYSLLQNHYSVCAWDQRGHGRSGREAAVREENSLVHVNCFRDYEKDMETVCDALLKDMPGPHAVFCHSMGGAVTGLFMEDHPGVFDRAVFCAPMIAPNRSGIPLFAGKLICRGAELLGHGSRRLFMSRPYDGPENFETSCASSRERFDWYDAVRVNTPAFHTNGPTYEWTKQSLSVTGWLLAPGAVEKITVPVRVYSAESDNSVLPEEQKRFAERLIRGKLIRVPGSRHEIYRSPDEVLFPWWHEILGFFGEAAG